MKTYLNPSEVALLEEAAGNLRDKLLIRVLFHLGCRVSEALNLAVEDVDFGNGRVTIEHLKARVSLSCPDCGERLGRKHSFCPKCGGRVTAAQAREREHRRQRVLPVDSGTLKMLSEYVGAGRSGSTRPQEADIWHQQAQGVADREGMCGECSLTEARQS